RHRGGDPGAVSLGVGPGGAAQAIRRLLADAGLRLRDVTHVALARDPKANRAAKLAYVARHPLNSAGAVVEHLGHAR
ncbi:MAG: hypothetical protein IT487_17915, partial [Chromatiaceae bacterium]|nr:hypothetical protein [Chromatiaceae bacterium]